MYYYSVLLCNFFSKYEQNSFQVSMDYFIKERKER